MESFNELVRDLATGSEQILDSIIASTSEKDLRIVRQLIVSGLVS